MALATMTIECHVVISASRDTLRARFAFWLRRFLDRRGPHPVRLVMPIIVISANPAEAERELARTMAAVNRLAREKSGRTQPITVDTGFEGEELG
jgi:hypothetical protein